MVKTSPTSHAQVRKTRVQPTSIRGAEVKIKWFFFPFEQGWVQILDGIFPQIPADSAFLKADRHINGDESEASGLSTGSGYLSDTPGTLPGGGRGACLTPWITPDGLSDSSCCCVMSVGPFNASLQHEMCISSGCGMSPLNGCLTYVSVLRCAERRATLSGVH